MLSLKQRVNGVCVLFFRLFNLFIIVPIIKYQINILNGASQ
ncbi:hypothetical protein XBKQ1_2920005 [Xenorhabdus bovienii str. kraussei Quebec]|uniref:Uncharacterized protein n=1 Tax=Xenorhabdus bovienii str. kraussei Quebec TaxID=1398203 RepID=A0A077PKK5_XENBV|nr:hypothetical protein XBKQ1_2920005 [Xenorhabdus bovienii str. kraussei Quebec]